MPDDRTVDAGGVVPADSVTELEQIYRNADGNYQKSVQFLGHSVSLIQDLVDLSQRIADVAAGSPLALKNEHIMGATFLLAARYYLVTGVADCLRLHLTDTYAKTRMAIEQVAFAARVKRHPHFARIWMNAGEDDAAYDEYREKFKKLFPADVPLLKELGERYDICAKRTHPSVHSFASRARVIESKRFYDFKFDYFEAASDGSEPVRTFFFILNTHLLISRMFFDVLTDAVAADALALGLRLHSVEAKMNTHSAAWLAKIPALRPLPES